MTSIAFIVSSPSDGAPYMSRGKVKQRCDTQDDEQRSQVRCRGIRDADPRGQRDIRRHARRALGKQRQYGAGDDPAGDLAAAPRDLAAGAAHERASVEAIFGQYGLSLSAKP